MSILLASAIFALTAVSPLQQPQPADRPALTEADADLSLTATVHFDTIRFDTTGTPSVEFRGNLFDRTDWSAERINLPERIEPGVTYRNAGIRFRILATFKAPEAFLESLSRRVPAVAVPAPPSNVARATGGGR